LRIRLLFTLAFFLAYAAAPVYASSSITPECLPVSVKSSSTKLPPEVPNFDSENRDYMIRTIAFEAGGESNEGKAAVAYVILNRVKSGGWGDSIKDVVTRPWQFEPWMKRREEMEKLSRDDPRYQHAAQIADAVLTGQMADPTAGATYFLNSNLVERRGGSLPEWARGEGQQIGGHTFYAPESVTLRGQTLRASGDSLSCPSLQAGQAAHHFG
jgi:spore germination cell wall hydrolase CwlJ-like protein